MIHHYMIRAPLSILIPWGLHPQEHFIHNNCQRPDVSNAVTEPGFQDIVPVIQGIIIRTEIQEPFLDMVHLKHEPIDDNLIRRQQGDGVHHGPGQAFHNIINDFLESRVFDPYPLFHVPDFNLIHIPVHECMESGHGVLCAGPSHTLRNGVGGHMGLQAAPPAAAA